MHLNIRTFFYSVFLFTATAVSLFFVFDTSRVSADTYQCDTPAQKAVCTELLNETEAQITALGTQLASTQTEGQSIARDKSILDIQVKQAQLKITASQLKIANLGKDIVAKTDTIATLQDQIDAGKQSLGQILRQTNELDDYSLPEVFLGSQSLSDAFADLDAFDSVKTAMSQTFTELSDAQKANEDAKQSLSTEQSQELDQKASIESQKAKVQSAAEQKQVLLNLNKTQQQNYQSDIATKAAQAAQIRAALFKLAGATAIPFGTALQYAELAQAKTDVDPAFLLAILTQESDLGANVGACYVTDQATGDGVRVSSGAAVADVMKPSRDITPFIAITTALGLDWTQTRVSCPLSIGYGGAMGPAQFIPSTWELFVPRLTTALGVPVPNPWNPPDAFMASALYLSDLGGTGGSSSAETRAACKYYGTGGSTCTYGRQVMAKVASIQENIDILNAN